MYKKSVQGWLKHLDFMILDVVCLWISFTLAFNMRHGSLDVLANSLYRDMMWSLALMDIVVIFFFDSLKNVLKRGFYQEFVKETYGRETKFIPNGVNRPVIRKPELIKEKFGLEKDDYVLFLGRLVPEKGIEDIRIFWFIQIRATNS